MDSKKMANVQLVLLEHFSKLIGPDNCDKNNDIP